MHDRGPVAVRREDTTGRFHRAGVAVDAQQAEARMSLEQCPRVAGAAEGEVDEGAVGYAPEQLHDRSAQDRLVGEASSPGTGGRSSGTGRSVSCVRPFAAPRQVAPPGMSPRVGKRGQRAELE